MIKNSKKYWSGLGKSFMVVAGALLIGLVGAALISLIGLIISSAFPVQSEIGPDNIAYMIGYLISIPLGFFLLTRLIFKLRIKFWILLLASITGFGFFAWYVFLTGLDAIDSNIILQVLFVVVFHLAPWITTALCSGYMVPKVKVQIPAKEA